MRYALFPVVLAAALAGGLYGIGAGLNPPLVVLGIVIVTAVIVAVSERIIPFEPAWRTSRGDVVTDMWHAIISNGALPPLYHAGLALAVAPVAAWVAEWTGAPVWPSSWPLLAQLALALMIGELGQYWAHRLAHERDFLWRLHSTHHSPARLYWLNAGRDHPLGVLLLFAPQAIPLLALGVGEEVFALFGLFTGVHGLFQHCNVDVRLGPLNWIFSMAELHRWHHSKIVAEANHNYGANIIVWDIVFRTRFLPDARPPEDVGIGDMPDFPKGYLGQLTVPVIWKRLRDPEG